MASTKSANSRRAGKSAAAFRTISEVAGDLDVPPHVLRFWETKFTWIGCGLYWPADLSLALDLEPQADNTNPLHLKTCDKIRDIAHRHGIKAVMHCASADFAAGAVKTRF